MVSAQDFADIPVGTEITIRWHTWATGGHYLSGEFLGFTNEQKGIKIRVQRRMNYGKQIGFDDSGRKGISDYKPSYNSTFNDQERTLDEIDEVIWDDPKKAVAREEFSPAMAYQDLMQDEPIIVILPQGIDIQGEFQRIDTEKNELIIHALMNRLTPPAMDMLDVSYDETDRTMRIPLACVAHVSRLD